MHFSLAEDRSDFGQPRPEASSAMHGIGDDSGRSLVVHMPRVLNFNQVALGFCMRHEHMTHAASTQLTQKLIPNPSK
jgi:hypothetical protein